MSTRALLLALIALFVAPAWGETLSTPQYRLKIDPAAKVIQRVDNGWEVIMTVEKDGERARIRWKPDGFTAIFPDGTLRVQLDAAATRSTYELTTDFEGKRYKVARTAREVSWVLPGQEIFFRTFGGKVTNVVGTSDFLNITRDTKGGRMSVESQAGTSDILLRKGKLEVFDGPEVLAHNYFVRGLAFQRGPITLEVPLPEEPFLNALPANRYLLIPSTAQHAPASETPEQGATPAPEQEVVSDDPLQAAPSTWDSPIYKANEGDGKEDPMNARREIRYPFKDRPLDAKTAPNSEEILKVQNY